MTFIASPGIASRLEEVQRMCPH